MNRHEDHRYIEALRKEDENLIKEIYQNFAPQVLKWVSRNSGSKADAKDIFQEGLISIYNKALDPKFILNCSLGALLFTICRNKWTDQLRKKSTRQKGSTEVKDRFYSDQQIGKTVEEIEEHQLKEKKLDNSFQQLSALCQQLLSLVAKNTRPAEIAAQLQMNEVNTVYRRKKACTDRWRALYQNKPN